MKTHQYALIMENLTQKNSLMDWDLESERMGLKSKSGIFKMESFLVLGDKSFTINRQSKVTLKMGCLMDKLHNLNKERIIFSIMRVTLYKVVSKDMER